jgi:two-component system, NarL family, sensor kinase
MKDRRGLQLLDGFRQASGKPAQQHGSLAQATPYNTAGSLPLLRREEIGSSLASALKASEQRLNDLLHDRSRIGRELHDSVLQALYAIVVTLAQSPALRKGAPQDLPNPPGHASDQLNSLIRDIRRMIVSVESDSVDPYRLVYELQALAQTCEKVSGLRIRVAVAPAAEEILTGEEARELVAIAREALSNCVRHARATQIIIALRHIGSRVRLRICDNGSGFEVTHEPAKGIGFAQMEDRVRKIGGRLNIQSTVGRGTCITADVYLEPVLTTI